MAVNIEKEVLQTEVRMEGQQPLKLLDSLDKQIKELAKLGRNIKLGVSKGDINNINDTINNLRTFRDRIQEITKISSQPAAAISDMAKRFKYLSNVLVPLKTSLKEINREMAAFRVAQAGVNTLYNKAEIQGRRDYINYGTQSGMRAQEIRLNQQAQKNERLIWQTENPAAAQAAKTQEDLNRSIYRATNILPVYQLHIMANYAAINKLVSGYKYLLNYTVQYDEELHQLQAISGTTTGTLKQMQKAIEDVAATTEFTSLELAKASTILAQAGLSATQIEGTLPAIARLATATGTDLNTSVETITSTLNIYNLQTSEAEHVTNALTTAMNESKANIAGFQQAIQYAGNLASQLGISFDETAAAISAAAQAGIRSKSMLGTGMRATLTELLKPTKKFKEQLASVGLTIDDINVKSKGYVNVLKTLREAGFGAEQAFRGLDRRAAAFLVTQIKQVDFMQELRSSMASSTAASKANEVQMDSLAKQYKTFQNNIANAATSGLEPFIRLLSNLLKILNQLANTPGVKQILGVLLTGATIGGGLKTLQLGLGALGAMIKSLSAMTVGVSLTKFINFFKIASSSAPAMMRLVAAFRGILSLPGLTALGMLGSTVYALGNAFGWWQSNLEKANEEMEKAKGEAEESRNKLSGVQELLQKVYDQKEKLQDQTERDIFVREILSKYPEITKYIDKVTMSYQELIETIKTLNDVTKVESAKKAADEAEAMLRAEKGRVKEAGKGITVKGLNDFLVRSSFSEIQNMPKDLANITQMYKGKEGWKFSNTRGVSLLLADTIKEILDDSKKQGKEALFNTISKLESESIAYGDKAIHQIVKDITTRYKKQLTAEEEGFGSTIAMISKDLRETSESYKSHQKAITEADNVIDIFKDRLKSGTEDIDSLLKQYKELEERRFSMSPLIDLSTGEKRDFGTYSTAEAARFSGFGDNIKEFQDAFNRFKEEQKKADGDKQRSDEEYQRLFLENENFRSDQIYDIDHKLSVIASLIANSKGGKDIVLGNSAVKYLENAQGIVNKKTGWAKKTRDATSAKAKDDLNKYINAVVAGAKTPTSGAFNGNISIYDTKGNMRDIGAILSDIEGVYRDTYGFNDKYLGNKMVEAKLAVQNIYNTNADMLDKMADTIDKNVPKFDVAAEKLNKFFRDLEADINKTETAYLNAEKALDSVLARQKGVSTSAGLAFGKSSGIVEYEQNKLTAIEESQMSARLQNLKNKRGELNDILTRLTSNEDYRSVTERYQNAYDRYNSALERGDYKEARVQQSIMNKLGSANKKYTEEEKKLTKEISELDKDIVELDTTLKQRNVFEDMSGIEQLKYGFRASASNYMEKVKNSGLTTIGGSMEYLSTQAIDSFDSSMTTMFQNIADGSKKAGDAFKDFGKQIIQTIRDVAIQMAVKQGLTALFGSLGFGTSTGTEEPTNLLSQTSWFGNAVGGLVKGPVKNRDSVPTMLMPGEFVMKKSAVDTIGRDYLEGLNANASAAMEAANESIGQAKSATTTESTGAGGIVNVYVVGQEQQQSMTPNDVLVTITQDMLKGGQTKKLVKSIAMGSI